MIVTEQSQRRFFRRVLAAFALASVWVLSPLGECAVYAADTSQAKAAEYGATIRRVSPKRTVLFLELDDGVTLRSGARIAMKIGDKTINGAFRKVSSKGSAIIRTAAPIPETTANALTFTILEQGSEGEDVKVSSTSGATLWQSDLMLDDLNREGLNGLGQLSLGMTNGTLKSSGGSAKESATFELSEREMGLNARVGYLQGAFGGGLQVDYLNGTSQAKADITTSSSGTKDSDSISEKTKSFSMLPYVAFKSSGGLGVALGYNIENKENDRSVKIAGVEGEHSPVVTKENGPRLEVSGSTDAVKASVYVQMVLGGKITEKSKKDVDHKKSAFGAAVVTKVAGLPSRIVLDYASSADKYSSGSLTTKVTNFDWQSELGMSALKLLPRFAYEMQRVSFGCRSGKMGLLTLGARTILGDRNAPYAGLEFNFKSSEETGGSTSPTYKTSAMGIGVQAGMAL